MGMNHTAPLARAKAQASGPGAASPWPLLRAVPTLRCLPEAPLRSVVGAMQRALAAPAVASPPGVAADQGQALPSGDWSALFDAVLERLRQGAAAPAAGVPAGGAPTVLACAQALQWLHEALALERANGLLNTQALAQAQASLALAQQDLAGSRKGERRARHQAQHDSLTALPNRRCFSARLQCDLLAGAEATPALAVLFLDLDGFKPINDRHGHAAGDRMLCIVADRLRRAVRAGDMVGRVGGDEFACLLQGPLGRPQLAQLACKLFDAVAAPLNIGALRLQVQPSIGIALCPEDGDSAAGLLQRADAAMYRAKRRQTGYAFFEGGGAVA